MLAGGPVWAQAALGSLHGTSDRSVGGGRDQGGCAGGWCRTERRYNATTNQTGGYDVKGLAAGKYGIKVTAKGFALYEVDGIDVGPGQSQKMDVSLSIAVQQENVNVSENAIGLDVSAENNATQMVLSGKDLDALSDDPDELADDLQALAGPSAGPNGGQIYIDGFTGGQLPPKSSIREIRINQNPFSPEYDKLGYGRIEIFTKPGTDQYHGQISVLGNSSYFNSTSPFATSNPSYDTTQYTANFGGPIGKKTSFFINFERRNIGDNAIVNAFVLDPTTFAARAVQHVGADSADAHQHWPAHGLSAHSDQYAKRAVSILAEQPDQPGSGAVLVANSGVQHARQPSRRCSSAIRSCSGRRWSTKSAFSTWATRINQTPATTDATLNVQGAFVGGGNSQGYNIDKQNHFEFQNYTSCA